MSDKMPVTMTYTTGYAICRVDNSNILNPIAISEDLCRATNNCDWKKLVVYFSSFEKCQLMAMYDRAVDLTMFEVAEAVMVYLECGNKAESCEYIFKGVKSVHEIWFEQLIVEHKYDFNRIDQLFKHLSPLELSIHVVSNVSKNYVIASSIMFQYIKDRCALNKYFGISYNRTMLRMNGNKTYGVELVELIPYLTTACKEKLYAGFGLLSNDCCNNGILVKLLQSISVPHPPIGETTTPVVDSENKDPAVGVQRSLEVFANISATFTPNAIGRNISGLSKFMIEVITDPMTANANLDAGIVSDAEIRHRVGTGFDVISWLCANEIIPCAITSTDLIVKLIKNHNGCCDNRIYTDKVGNETSYSPLILAIDFSSTQTIVEKVTAILAAHDWSNNDLTIRHFLCALYNANQRALDRWKNHRDVLDTIVKLLFERGVMTVSLADYFELNKYSVDYIKHLLGSFGSSDRASPDLARLPHGK